MPKRRRHDGKPVGLSTGGRGRATLPGHAIVGSTTSVSLPRKPSALYKSRCYPRGNHNASTGTLRSSMCLDVERTPAGSTRFRCCHRNQCSPKTAWGYCCCSCCNCCWGCCCCRYCRPPFPCCRCRLPTSYCRRWCFPAPPNCHCCGCPARLYGCCCVFPAPAHCRCCYCSPPPYRGLPGTLILPLPLLPGASSVPLLLLLVLLLSLLRFFAAPRHFQPPLLPPAITLNTPASGGSVRNYRRCCTRWHNRL